MAFRSDVSLTRTCTTRLDMVAIAWNVVEIGMVLTANVAVHIIFNRLGTQSVTLVIVMKQVRKSFFNSNLLLVVYKIISWQSTGQIVLLKFSIIKLTQTYEFLQDLGLYSVTAKANVNVNLVWLVINAIVVIITSTILVKMGVKSADVTLPAACRIKPLVIQSLEFVRVKKMSKEDNVRSMWK